MKKSIIIITLFYVMAFAQQKQRVAVLPSVGELESQRLSLLTDKVREVASKTLPINNFVLLKEDAVIEMIGNEDYFVACKEGTCIGELAKKANANYGARCDVFKIDDNLVLKFELYSVKDEAILETFTDYNAKDFIGILAVLEERLPNAFKKMISSSSIAISQPAISSGIVGVEGATGYIFDSYERRYVVNLNTEPQGANLSFNGVPIGNCNKTPCKVELSESNVRILAALEQYETADTTVSIKQNNQSINIKLKPNFGVLEIKPAYKDSIGEYKQWSLTINNKAHSYFENNLSPGNYDIKLNHECYEDISFKAGINKGDHEIFNMSSHIQLKMGGLVLSSEQDDEPTSELVFVNGKKVGETPFSGSVPMCAEISIGNSMDKANIKLIHNQTIKHKHQSSNKIFTDSRDGNKYKFVKIGKQTWMAENLNYNASGSKCYDNKNANCNKYGRLYNWNTATKACPEDWYLPTSTDWDKLLRFVDGTEGTSSPYKSETAGKYLKAKSGWNNNGNGLDTYGFAALPGGYIFSDGSSPEVGSYSLWWAGSKSRTNDVYYHGMYYGNNVPYMKGYEDEFISVRCLQNDGNIGTKGGMKVPTAKDIDIGDGSGARSKQEIMQVVTARTPGLRSIYNKYLKQKPGFSGKVTLKFTIASVGEIINISIASSTTGYPEFDNAVKNMVGTWKWKAIKSGDVITTIPFTFTE